MRLPIRLTPRAYSDIEDGVRWRARFSQQEADRWRDWISAQLETLGDNPQKYPLADEADEWEREVRQAVVGKRKNKYRVLFEIRDDEISVLYILHASRGPIE